MTSISLTRLDDVSCLDGVFLLELNQSRLVKSDLYYTLFCLSVFSLAFCDSGLRPPTTKKCLSVVHGTGHVDPA